VPLHRAAILCLTVATALTLWPATAARHPPPSANAGVAASRCARAIAQGAVCEAANKRAIELMNSADLEAATVVQDVQTGSLVAFVATSASNSARRDVRNLAVTAPVLPLSLTKMFLAASWWDRGLPDTRFDCLRSAAGRSAPEKVSMTIHEMIAIGCDLPAKQMATALRKSVGTKAVLADLNRFGFGPRPRSSLDNSFWAELAPDLRPRLLPASAYTLLSAGTKDPEWADTLSLGETKFIVTPLHISRFLQAVGNQGVMISPVARVEGSGNGALSVAQKHRIMQESAALRLQAALRDVVQRGSAQSISHTLDGTGWQIGGKTGTGPGPAPIGPHSDGWFAGLVFDPQGRARFTVATFVRHGGRGGGNAAMISAKLARFLIEN
jgi:cell division protein FtsI/penicillin-binding protein 2